MDSTSHPLRASRSMRILTLLASLVELTVLADPQTFLKEGWSESTRVAVVHSEGGRRVGWLTYLWHSHALPYDCVFDVTIDANLKGGGAAKIGLRWLSNKPDCDAPMGVPAEDRFFLAFLSQVGDVYSPTKWRAESLKSLPGYTFAQRKAIESSRSPEESLAFVLLSPTLRLSRKSYVTDLSTVLGPVFTVVGFIESFRALRRIYLEGDDEIKDEMAQSMARLGLCVTRLRSRGLLTRDLAGDVERFNGGALMDLKAADRRILKEHRSVYGAEILKATGEGLPLFACNSEPQIRLSARTLLEEHFKVRLTDSDCIPCDVLAEK